MRPDSTSQTNVPTSWNRHRQRIWRMTPEFRRWRHVVGGAYLSAISQPRLDIRRFVLVTSGRTGSELLVQMLNSHPDVVCDSEVLDYGPDFARLFLRGRAVSAARAGASVHGFKLVANQLQWPVLVRQPQLLFDDLDHAGLTFVRIRRQDIVRQAVSHERAKALDIWHGASPALAPQLCPADVIRTLVWLDEQEHRLDEFLAGRAVHEIVYETDLATPEQQRVTAAALFGLFGVDEHQPMPRVRRDSPGPTSDMVANWHEVEAAIENTRFRSLLSVGD